MNPPSAGPAMNDLIGGHIDLMIDLFGNASQNIGDGKLKLLAVTAQKRMPEAPDVPAISEVLPGYSHQEWFAIVAPPNTPAAIATKLSAAISEILRLPDVAKRLTEFAAEPVGNTPAEATAFVEAESKRWREVIDLAGIKNRTRHRRASGRAGGRTDARLRRLPGPMGRCTAARSCASSPRLC